MDRIKVCNTLVKLAERDYELTKQGKPFLTLDETIALRHAIQDISTLYFEEKEGEQ